MLWGWVCFLLRPLSVRTVGRVGAGCLFKKLADHTPDGRSIWIHNAVLEN
jgi:hypothetical protein